MCNNAKYDVVKIPFTVQDEHNEISRQEKQYSMLFTDRIPKQKLESSWIDDWRK